MRLNNFISESGFCSRRKADQYISEQRVFVNGEVAVLGAQVNEGDEVYVDKKLIEAQTNFITIVYNKPLGITATTDQKDPTNMIKAIHFKQRIFPIGRLDKDSEGLILLTNDGQSVNKILRAENEHEKEYHVELDRYFDNAFMRRMEKGIEIYNPVKNEYVSTNPCSVKRVDSKTFSIILKQGYNRQIRRMVKECGYRISKLKRTRIMHIELGDLKKGEWRILSEDELKRLHEQID